MSKFRLLFCDDESLSIQWMRLALAEVKDFIDFDEAKDWSASVTETLDLIKSRSFNYDIVVTDMIFEAEDRLGGFTILEAVKRNHPYSEVIILTGYTEKISISELFRVEGIYELSQSTWIRKEGAPEEIGRRLAEALRRLLPSLERQRNRRWTGERPYQLKLDETSNGFTLLVAKDKLVFHVRGLQSRHLRVLQLLSQCDKPVGEQQLIEMLYSGETDPGESTARFFPREQLLGVARVIGSPANLCEQYLSGDGTHCGNYSGCFPTLSKSAVSKTTHHSKSFNINWWQCPLHWRITDSLAQAERKRPKRMAVDINFIRSQVIKSVGDVYGPLSRSGEKNDLLRRTDYGYWLAATMLK